MGQHSLASLHKNVRKRIHEKHQEYPHPDSYRGALDKIIYAVSLITPIMIIPQVLVIWVDRNAGGVSPITWGVFLLASVVWLLYGLAHKEKPIIINNTLLIVLNFFVLSGALIYG